MSPHGLPASVADARSGRARLLRTGRFALAAAGFGSVLSIVWLALGLPLGIDRWLNVTSPPVAADAIVCIGGGTMEHELPTADGWQRIQTSVALFADAYAPAVIFTGRGNARLSEAQIYADAAEWLGLPRDAIHLDPLPASTAEHPGALLQSQPGLITPRSRLLLVTSKVHSRRVLMTFRSYGFTNVSVVSDYAARRPAGRNRGTAAPVSSFVRDDKRYSDPLFTLAARSSAMFVALREWSAILVYRWHGLV